MIPLVIRSFLLGVSALLIFLSCHRSPSLEELHQRANGACNVHLTGRNWAMLKERPGVQKLWSRFEILFLNGSSKIVTNCESGSQFITLIAGGAAYRYRYWPYYEEADVSSYECKECRDIWNVLLDGMGLVFEVSSIGEAKRSSPPWLFGFPNPQNKDLIWFRCPDVDPYGGSGIAEISYREFRIGIRPGDGLIQYASIIYTDSSGRDEIISYSQVDKIDFGTVRPTDLRLPAAAANADWEGIDGRGIRPPSEFIARQ